MTLKPFKHQMKFTSEYEGKNILAWEGGTGKTIAGCLWLKDGRDRDALVVCPKRVEKKWIDELKLWGAKATVIYKEEFKKTPYKQWSAIVIDEADEFASPIFTSQRSQLTEKMYNLLKKYPTQTLLLTGTPVRSTPWNLHTLLVFSGHYVDWKKWRDYFFVLDKMPYMPRMGWIPKKNWRKLIQPIIWKYCDVVLLSDCVDDIPPITVHKVKVDSPKYEAEKWDGKEAFVEEHRNEQLLKHKEIINIGRDFRKVLVVAYYRNDIDRLQKELSKDKPTFAIYGGVKNQEDIIKQAQEADDCYFIVQASLGVGFDGDKFSCCIFTSMSYAVRDWVQMKWRIRRIHNLRPVVFYYLLGGRCDRAVLRNVELGKDFVPSEWHGTPTTTKETPKERSED